MWKSLWNLNKCNDKNSVNSDLEDIIYNYNLPKLKKQLTESSDKDIVEAEELYLNVWKKPTSWLWLWDYAAECFKNVLEWYGIFYCKSN